MIQTMPEGKDFCCALCRGKGRLAPSNGYCPACGGGGLVKVSLPAMMCVYCNGRGEVPARSGITCTVCRGKGVVPVQLPVEICPQCRGTGAAPNSKLPCLLCRGKGVVTTGEHGGTIAETAAEALAWVAVRPKQVMTEGMGIIAAREGRPEAERDAEASPVFLRQIPLPAQGNEANEARTAGNGGPSQRRRQTRTVSPGAVGGLVRRLMAIEKARLLGTKATDLGRYALEKRTQRWREARKPFE